MRKCKVYLALFFLMSFSFLSVSAAFAAEESPIGGGGADGLSVVMAINQRSALSDGVRSEITSPILVFNKTYVDLYDTASILHYQVKWTEDEVGYFQAAANNHTCNFTAISRYDDLIYQEQKYFVKQDKVFVSLRELTNLLGYPLKYDSGIIYVGDENAAGREIYGEINTYAWDDYVYVKYPYWAEHVVNPYQEYSYDSMMNDAKRLQQIYPDIVKTSSIGNSVEGRELLLLEVGHGDKKIFVCGTHHAREYIATAYLMYAIDRYAYAYRTDSMWGSYNPREILDNVTFCIVPMVNPDGVNLVQNGIYATEHADELANMILSEGKKYGYASWKANIHGVDVNWNYDKDWSVSRNRNSRGSSGFNGDYPGSEPETAAVTAYVDNHAFDVFLSFHTQGQIFYWADSKSKPLNIHQAVKNDTGFAGVWDSGTGAGGSFFDYVYRKFDKPTITVELCPYIGNYPYPNEDFDTVWSPAKNILLVVGNEILYK